MTRTVLACRLDNIGDVVLTGPAVRAVARRARVVMLASPSGAEAARMLPGVDEVVEFDAPWVGYRPAAVERERIGDLVDRLRSFEFDEAIIFTSFHQSCLPLALLLRLAGIGRITAISEDYPGSLLDVRCAYRDELHEVEQNLDVATAAGFAPDPSDDLRLRLVPAPGSAPDVALPSRYVVVHPGASVAARALPGTLARDIGAALASHGCEVVVTGSPDEHELAARTVDGLGSSVRSVAGLVDLQGLCHILAGADAVVCGNTGPAHLAAAFGTPVVELFAPVVDPLRWRPWGVPHRLLGDLAVPCAGCRARVCPRPEQVCVGGVHAVDAVRAVHTLVDGLTDGLTDDLGDDRSGVPA